MSRPMKPFIMYWSITAHSLLVLCVATMFSVQVVTADYQLEVRLVSYSNPGHRKSDGSRCDSSSRCDNIFSFEIDVGDGWEQPQETGPYRNNDNIIFGDTLIGGRANPLVFTGVQWSNIQLHVMVCDLDSNRCEDVFDEVRTIELRQETTPLTIVSTTSSGEYSRTLQLSYQVICLPDYYGPECSVYCVPRDDSIGRYTCSETDGTKICLPDYYGPECSVYCVSRNDSIGHYVCNETVGTKICLPDYHGTECSVYCVSRNDSIGHYTCNETDGTKICLPDYYGPECLVYCVPRNNSIGYYACNETDGTKICLPDYYGPECSVYCVPRNDSSGHYTCDESDGSKICMPGFGGENCTMAQTTDGQEHTQSTSGVGVAVGGAVAGVSVLVVLILLTITAVWVARKKYHKERVISTDAEEHHYKGADNPIYTTHYNNTNELTVRQDSPTRELTNPIYGSVLQVEDEPTISDTKGIKSTYSLSGPQVDPITFGNADTGEEYVYVAHGTRTTS